jgi:hypothetical protein
MKSKENSREIEPNTGILEPGKGRKGAGYTKKELSIPTAFAYYVIKALEEKNDGKFNY